MCLFLFVLVLYIEHFTFIFLAEKFTLVTVQQANYAIILTGLCAYLVF